MVKEEHCQTTLVWTMKKIIQHLGPIRLMYNQCLLNKSTYWHIRGNQQPLVILRQWWEIYLLLKRKNTWKGHKLDQTNCQILNCIINSLDLTKRSKIKSDQDHTEEKICSVVVAKNPDTKIINKYRNSLVEIHLEAWGQSMF
jgi:hypothetical protein